MNRSTGAPWDPVAGAAAATWLVALVWLGALLLDQLVFFGDVEQTRDAATARVLMIPAAGVMVAAAVVVALRTTRMHGAALAVPPILCAALTWFVPQATYGLLAYPLTAPFGIAPATAAVIPAAARARRATAVAVGLLLAGAILAISVLGILPLAFLFPAAVVVAWSQRRALPG